MRFEICTLFPEFFHSFFTTGLVARAVDNGILSYAIHNLRLHGEGRYRSVDDAPFGGGAGMLLKYDVIRKSLEATGERPVIHLTPRGRVLNTSMAKRLASLPGVTLLCGHYEGIDQRILDRAVGMEVSIGDYVLGGGETPAQVLIETIARHLPGFLTEASLEAESFESGLLEHDQFTRPREADGVPVPGVLVEGDPKRIAAWQRENALWRTWRRRPDLFARQTLADCDFDAIHGKIVTHFSIRPQETP
ncbi:MAG: tRNA (guanosine(37)-N1)-methyltransferase TrmD [Spirochaetes bacterium]|nr:tRNA (guanosine(37)-N1)-methyltransferase TrmD [Spirochaetota bacterium]